MKTLATLFLLAALAACASSETQRVPLSVRDISAPDNTLLIHSGDVKISPLDVLEIKVFDSTELNGSYQVDPIGQIKFPLVGPLKAEGYTSFELATEIETMLREKYLQNPQVTVRLAEVNGRQFTIEGAISRPGMYPVRGPTTLLQALAVSGGPSNEANLSGVIIFRTISGERTAARFDVRKIRSGESVDPAVYGNDVIVIDGREKNEAYEEVLRGLPVIGIFALLF